MNTLGKGKKEGERTPCVAFVLGVDVAVGKRCMWVKKKRSPANLVGGGRTTTPWNGKYSEGLP